MRARHREPQVSNEAVAATVRHFGHDIRLDLGSFARKEHGFESAQPSMNLSAHPVKWREKAGGSEAVLRRRSTPSRLRLVTPGQSWVARSVEAGLQPRDLLLDHFNHLVCCHVRPDVGAARGE